MMRFPIEIELVTAGLGMPNTLRVARITTLLFLMAGYVPSTLMPILDPTNPRRLILLISFDYLPDLIREFPTLYSTERLPAGDEITGGENTPG